MSTTPDMKKPAAAAAPADAAPARRPSPREVVSRVLAGDLGSLRVIVVLAIIWTIFAISNDRFLTAINLTNLSLQIAAVGCISIGVVLVLLLGEIDLSVGAVSGLAASIVAVLNVKHGWNPYLAMLAGVGAGAVIGAFQGTVATRLEIPTFVVTLAGLLAWQGAQLRVLGETGTVNVNEPAITNIANVFLADWLSWALALACIAVLVLAELQARRRRGAAQLEQAPLAGSVARLVGAAIAILGTVLVVNKDRGVPLALVILVGLVTVMHLLLTRTTFGRHVYAVGGNAEAARRAGISVVRIRTLVFVLASMFAAFGGIVAMSRLLAVNQGSGGSDLLLLAIAGPVVAGTSLFGGRGTVWAALLGALVIGSISNGMDLLAFESSTKYMVTGGVLLGAVSLDAISRKQRSGVRR